MFKEKLSKISTRVFYVIFALVVSVSLWLYVEITENDEQISEVGNIRIVFKNEDVLRDRGLLITSVEPELLSLTFETTRANISRLAAPDALTVEVDLASITSAGTTFLAYEISFPPGVSSNAVVVRGRSASRITLAVDRLMERQVPVWVNYTGGTASEELVAEDVMYDPHSITVWGPEGAVSRIHHVRVPIFRENLSTTYTDDLGFLLFDDNDEELDDSLWDLVEFSQETIRVTVLIREIKDVPLTIELFHGASTSDTNTLWRAEPAVIKVSGDPDVIRDINNIMLGPIDMLSFGIGDTKSFPIIIPDHITNISGEIEALVHVEVLGMDIAFVSTSNLHVINTPPGYRADILTQSLDVRIRGATEDLAPVTPMNIRVVADLSEMSSGTTRVPARVYIDGIDAAIDPVGEYLITVTIVAE